METLRWGTAALLVLCLAIQSLGAGGWSPRSERPASVPDQVPSWPTEWSRDSDHDRLDDELEGWMADPSRVNFDVLVCFEHRVSGADVLYLERAGAGIGLRSSYLPLLGATVPRGSLAELAALPGVARIEADARLRPVLDTSVPAIGVDRVWRDFGLRGEGVTICVVDSGMDGNHSSLDDLDDINSTRDPKIIAFYDAADQPDLTDGSLAPFDRDGHGTHVAGVTAGTGDGSPSGRFVGIAPAARLVGVKILRNASTDMASSDAIRGIEWAMANRGRYDISVLSMSFGSAFTVPGLTNDGTSALSQLCDRAVQEGLVVVAAAGNSGPARRSIAPPGDAREVITVGNVRDDGTLNPTSSRGPVGRFTSSYTKPDVCAPGTDIYSAEANSGGRYVSATGTSDSCPHVSGLSALMLQAFGDLRPGDVKSILHSTAEPGAMLPWQDSPNNDYGWGVVNAYRAVENCTNGTLPPVVHIDPMEKASGTVTITGTASSAHGTVRTVEVRIDTEPYRTAAGTTNWSLSWDTSGYRNGAHQVSARAFDGSVFSYEHRITVTVDNLLVKLDPPRTQANLTGTYVFTGSAEGGNLVRVEVRLDGRDWKTAEDTSNRTFRTWRYEVNTTKLSNGLHRLEARAYDGTRYSEPSEVEFSVDNPVPRKPAASKALPGMEGLQLLVVMGCALALALWRGGRAPESG